MINVSLAGDAKAINAAGAADQYSNADNPIKPDFAPGKNAKHFPQYKLSRVV